MERDERGEDTPSVGLDSCGRERADALVSRSTDSRTDVDIAKVIEQHEIEARITRTSGLPVDDRSDRLAPDEKVAVVPVAVHRIRAAQRRGIGGATDVDDLTQEYGGFSARRAYWFVHREELDVSAEQRADDAFGPVAALRHRVPVSLPEVQHLSGMLVLEHLGHHAVAVPLQRVGVPGCRPRPIRVGNRYSSHPNSSRDLEGIRKAVGLLQREDLQDERSSVGCFHRERSTLTADQATDHVEAEFLCDELFHRQHLSTPPRMMRCRFPTMSIEDSYNFRRIHEGLTTSGVVGAALLSGLHAEGYQAVINLLPDSSEHAVADEASIVRDQGLDYVYIPVDFEAPTHADLEAFADAMDARTGQKVHVHCAANYRVSAFYSLYALRKGLCAEAEAHTLVHDVWDPADHPAWMAFISDEQTRMAT